MVIRSSFARLPSRRLRAGRILGLIGGLAGLLVVPAAYFRALKVDPSAQKIPTILLMLVFFPACGWLCGFLAGVVGAMVIDRIRSDASTN
ncbi:MAG: hypothetical protein ACKO4T_06145 [Planctomycetaceae bacterium]